MNISSTDSDVVDITDSTKQQSSSVESITVTHQIALWIQGDVILGPNAVHEFVSMFYMDTMMVMIIQVY
jgi:hypothetical protein